MRCMSLNNHRTGIVLSYTSTVLSMVCGLLLSSYVLRVLGAFEYGLYKTIAAFISYLVILEVGTGAVMCRNLLVAQQSGEPNAVQKITATVWYITVFVSVVILCAGIGFYAGIEDIYQDTIPSERMDDARQMFLIMLVYLLASFYSQTLSGTFLGHSNYVIGNVINIAKIVARTGILLVALISVRSSMVIVLTDLVISLCILVFSIAYVCRNYDFSFSLRHFEWNILKASMPLSFALLLQTFITQANSNIAMFIISIKISMESVALYSVALYIYSMFGALTTVPISVYMPQVAANIGKGLTGRALMETLVPSGRIIALIGGTVLFGFIAVGIQFIDIIYGEQYREAWVIAILILTPMFLNMTGGSIVNVLDVYNKRHVRSYMLIVTTVLNILLTLWLIGQWGAYAAAFATGVSILSGQVLLMNIYYQRAFSINMYALYLKAFRGLLVSQALAMLVGGGVGLLITNKYLSFVSGGTAFVVVEAVCLLWFGLNQEEKQTLSLTLQKLKQH